MNDYLKTLDFAFERQKELRGEAKRERTSLSYVGYLSAVRDALHRAAQQIGESQARQAELCLEAGPACEMLFPA